MFYKCGTIGPNCRSTDADAEAEVSGPVVSPTKVVTTADEVESTPTIFYLYKWIPNDDGGYTTIIVCVKERKTGQLQGTPPSPLFWCLKIFRLCNFANECLQQFIAHSAQLLGAHFVVYNVHNLIHLHSECLNGGTLNNFSAYKFENYLGVIKRYLLSTYKPLAQIYNRDLERNGRLIQKLRSTAVPDGEVVLTVTSPLSQCRIVVARLVIKFHLGAPSLQHILKLVSLSLDP
ncbi:hypothetical protein FOCC_FOCC014120 [Frankliniella occidentalis]|nr:hypothetical protein FOCC_FOCC014120 [Frankliniella occidentalis]